MRTALPIALLLGVAACDYSGDFLFSAVEGVPSIIHLEEEGGGPIVPRDVLSTQSVPDAVRDATIYVELGPTGTAAQGGLTFEIVGTGSTVCVVVDPESVAWNQAVSARPQANRRWAYPDNLFDDGDVDLYGGQTVFYTGSPGEAIGDFQVDYEDSLGNAIPVSLEACSQLDLFNDPLGHSGRGAPEMCDVAAENGVRYTMVVESWSTPLDDDRMSFGILVVDGECQDLLDAMVSTTAAQLECVIRGESLAPRADTGPWYGDDQVEMWPDFEDLEDVFCSGANNLVEFCEAEAAVHDGAGGCSWNDAPEADSRCYCGDPDATPTGGAI